MVASAAEAVRGGGGYGCSGGGGGTRSRLRETAHGGLGCGRRPTAVSAAGDGSQRLLGCGRSGTRRSRLRETAMAADPLRGSAEGGVGVEKLDTAALVFTLR